MRALKTVCVQAAGLALIAVGVTLLTGAMGCMWLVEHMPVAPAQGSLLPKETP